MVRRFWIRMLLREANVAHEIVEAGVRPQRVKAGIYFRIQKPWVVRVVGLIKPLECFLFPAQPGVSKSYLVPPHAMRRT
jgi:hypothetical protein